MIVSDLMKTPVTSVEPGTTLADAARIMLAQHLTGLPVVEDGRLVGVITEGDLLRRVEIGTAGKEGGWLRAFFMPGSLADDFVRTHGRHVRDVMTARPVSVTPQTELREAAEIMGRRRVKRLPVVEHDCLVGVISRSDLLRVLARKLIDLADPLTETEIKAHIVETLAREPWAPRSGIRINVKGGVVELEGIVFSGAEQRAVRVIAETTPGVAEVHDHLVYVDPGSGMSIPAA